VRVAAGSPGAQPSAPDSAARRPPGHGRSVRVLERVASVAHLPVQPAAAALGVSCSTMKRWRRQIRSPRRPGEIIVSSHRIAPKGADDDRDPQCVPPEVREGA
jgi:hypothetical protein